MKTVKKLVEQVDFSPAGSLNLSSWYRMKTSFSEWVGLVPRSAKRSPDLSVFVVFAKPVSDRGQRL